MAIYLGNHLALQNGVSALNFALKANLASPAFTGTPTAPTAAAGTNTTQLATAAFVQAALAALADSAPETLDTLNELAAALGDDPNFATTITNLIAEKAKKAVDFTATLLSTGWSASAPYSQTVAVTGITADDEPFYDVVLGETIETRTAQNEAFSMITDLNTATDSITVTCDTDKPTIDIPLRLKVVY